MKVGRVGFVLACLVSVLAGCVLTFLGRDLWGLQQKAMVYIEVGSGASGCSFTVDFGARFPWQSFGMAGRAGGDLKCEERRIVLDYLGVRCICDDNKATDGGAKRP